MTYTIPVSNAGPATATGVTVLSKLTGVKLASASASDGGACVVVKGGLSCNLGTLSVGATDTITIVAAAPRKAGTASISSTASATSSDPAPGNNSSTESTSVQR